MKDLFGLISPIITIGNIIEILSILGGGLLVLIRLNNTVITLKTDVNAMQTEIKKIAEVLTKLAVTENRLANIEEDIRGLRRGDGFIRGVRGIDKQYP